LIAKLLNYNKKFSNSTTLMSWFSFSSKILNLFLVLPLILRTFTENELAVYFIFVTIISTSNIIDFGFKSTFVRIFTYASVGLKTIDKLDVKSIKPKRNEVNWELTEKIFSATKRIYFIISILLFIFLSVVGTLLVKKPINLNEDVLTLWLAWGFVVVTSTIGFYGKIYICYLEGFNKVALLKKVEGYFSFITVFSKLVVLYFWPTIFTLIIVEKIWLVINLVRNLYLSKKINDNKISNFVKIKGDSLFIKKVFNLAWKNGVSGILSVGLTNFTGLIYAQIGNTSMVNSYLLSLRVLTLLRDFSKVPFYSKIPLLSKLRAEQNIEKLASLSKKTMTLSNVIFIFGAIIIGLFSNQILTLIGSNVKFVSYDLWLLLSIAFFIHRYGAMHLQLYLTTNHIISHIVDSISGLIFIIICLLLYQYLDLYTFPIAMIISYLSCHSWVSAKYSLRSMNKSFWSFDKYNIFIFLLCILSLILYYYG
jgi:O-antigen/teichoic acid export membrane protein